MADDCTRTARSCDSCFHAGSGPARARVLRDRMRVDPRRRHLRTAARQGRLPDVAGRQLRRRRLRGDLSMQRRKLGARHALRARPRRGHGDRRRVGRAGLPVHRSQWPDLLFARSTGLRRDSRRSMSGDGLHDRVHRVLAVHVGRLVPRLRRVLRRQGDAGEDRKITSSGWAPGAQAATFRPPGGCPSCPQEAGEARQWPSP